VSRKEHYQKHAAADLIHELADLLRSLDETVDDLPEAVDLVGVVQGYSEMADIVDSLAEGADLADAEVVYEVGVAGGDPKEFVLAYLRPPPLAISPLLLSSLLFHPSALHLIYL